MPRCSITEDRSRLENRSTLWISQQSTDPANFSSANSSEILKRFTVLEWNLLTLPYDEVREPIKINGETFGCVHHAYVFTVRDTNICCDKFPEEAVHEKAFRKFRVLSSTRRKPTFLSRNATTAVVPSHRSDKIAI